MAPGDIQGQRVSGSPRKRLTAGSVRVEGQTHLTPSRRPTPGARTPTVLLALQAVAGNRAVIQLMHTEPDGASPRMLPLQRDIDPDSPSWTTLSAPARAQARKLYDECDDSLGILDEAQMLRVSGLRSSWQKVLRKIRARIETVDTDQKLEGVRNAFHDVEQTINRVIVAARAEWSTLEQRYLDERRWLLSTTVRSTDTVEAAKYLDGIYAEIKPSLPFLTTDDDFAALKQAMDKQEYVRVGALRGTRIRVQKLQQLMRTVADLTRKGEDAAKFIPDWQQRVNEEAVYLETFAALATSRGRDYGNELTELRRDLVRQRQETEAIKPPKNSIVGNGVAMVKGGVEAFVGIFVEAAKEVVDLVQIDLHYVTMGRYEPRLISDMAKAAEQGATTADLLWGMATGMVETPARFLKACRDGDWEAIGRESVNLYLLAKTLKEAPETVRKAANAATRIPELIARTNESLRILRQRTVALGLENEVRLAPEPTGKSLEPGQDPVTLKGPDQEGGPRVREEGGGAKNGPKKSDTGEQEAILVANKKGKKGQVREEEELRGAEHDKGKRKSTQHDHQVGQSRKKADQEAADERSSEATSIAQRRRQNQVLEEIRRAAKNLPDKIQDFHRDTRKPLDVRLADLKKRLLEANSPTNVDNLLKDVGLTEKQLIEYLDNNGMLPPSE